MGRSKRNLRSWDYNILHKTGKRVSKFRGDTEKEGGLSEDKMAETGVGEPCNTESLVQNEIEIYEEINEFFEENLLDEALSIPEIDNNLFEVKELRRIFKRVHRQMKNIGDDYEKNYENKLDELMKIWKYLCDAKIEKGSRLDNYKMKNNENKKEEEKQRKRIDEDNHISGIKLTEINEKITYIGNLCASSDSCEDEILELKSSLNNIDK